MELRAELLPSSGMALLHTADRVQDIPLLEMEAQRFPFNITAASCLQLLETQLRMLLN